MPESTLTIGQKLRAMRALARAENHYESLGYDPVEAVELIYGRAVKYYDSVFPDDEPDFRTMLLNRYERSLKRAHAQRRKEQLEKQTKSAERSAEIES